MTKRHAATSSTSTHPSPPPQPQQNQALPHAPTLQLDRESRALLNTLRLCHGEDILLAPAEIAAVKVLEAMALVTIELAARPPVVQSGATGCGTMTLCRTVLTKAGRRVLAGPRIVSGD